MKCINIFVEPGTFANIILISLCSILYSSFKCIIVQEFVNFQTHSISFLQSEADLSWLQTHKGCLSTSEPTRQSNFCLANWVVKNVVSINFTTYIPPGGRARQFS